MKPERSDSMKHVLFAASECTPFIKSGGLADVIGSLPQALVKEGARVSVILPLYKEIINSEYRGDMEEVMIFNTPVGWRNQYTRILKYEGRDVTYYFVDNEYYFNRDGLYGYIDDGERFVYFSNAIIEFMYRVEESYDILHCHDWQTGAAVAIGSIKRPHPGMKIIYTIHNIQYQGWIGQSAFGELFNLGREHFAGFEWQGMLNMMKAAIHHADVITTVSETYAEEIMTPFFGEGLEQVLEYRRGDLHGVINGLDTYDYNPVRDEALYHRYRSSRKTKAKNKTALQQDLGLTVDENIPMYGIVTRLVNQKGIDLVEHIMHEFLMEDVQLVVLGSGEALYEDYFKSLVHSFPDKVHVTLGFSESYARKIYAASDFFIMPSLFEPCGLGQLIAIRYLTAPIVRETGGLKDTVIPYNEFTHSGNGFSFENYNAHELLNAMKYSLYIYHQKEHMDALCRNMTASDYSWANSARQYMALYGD